MYVYCLITTEGGGDRRDRDSHWVFGKTGRRDIFLREGGEVIQNLLRSGCPPAAGADSHKTGDLAGQLLAGQPGSQQSVDSISQTSL